MDVHGTPHNHPVPQSVMTESSDAFDAPEDFIEDASERKDHEPSKNDNRYELLNSVSNAPNDHLLQNSCVLGYARGLGAHRLWLNKLCEIDLYDPEENGCASRAHRSGFCSAVPGPILRRMMDNFNSSSSTVYKSTYTDGCIFLCVPIFDRNYSPESTITIGSTNVILPRIMTLEFYFVVASTDIRPVMCYPMITRGGLCTLTTVYWKEIRIDPLSPHALPPITFVADLVMIPFAPYDIGLHEVRFLHTEFDADPLPDFVRSCGTTSLSRYGNVVLVTLSAMHWERRVIYTDVKQKHIQFVSWFNAEWPGEPLNDDVVWVACQNIKYRRLEMEFGINIEKIYALRSNTYVIGSVCTSFINRTPGILFKKLPTSATLYFTLRHRERHHNTFSFTQNPKLLVSGDAMNAHCHTLNEPRLKELTLTAPYEIRFVNNRHTVQYSIQYSHNSSRCFLIAGVPNNELFHTSMQIWEPNTSLRVSLRSHKRSLHIPQSAPIAILYCIERTEGRMCDRSTFITKTQDGQRSGYLGDLRLPYNNFFGHNIK